ncbi:hypothetical protein BJX64DRAFT_285511 [Aspergillus heterothallicus]
MTVKEDKGDVGYTEQLKAIQTTVGELVPTLQDEGRNLFKYDPSHDFGLGGEFVKMAKLWVEGRVAPYHDDVWN